MSYLHKPFVLFCFLQEFTMHDTIGCYLDTEKGQIKFSKNGRFYSLSLESYLDAFSGGEGGRGMHTLASLTEPTLLAGKDLGLAFEIPPHIRNQALFAACVLKVIGILQMSKIIMIFLGFLNELLKYKIYLATYSYCSCACKISFLQFTSIHYWSNNVCVSFEY